MSNRQTTLLNRMKSAKERYEKTRKELDTMLLNKLHSNNVYTPDTFNKTYVTREQAVSYVNRQLSNNNGRSSKSSDGREPNGESEA